MSNLPPGVKTSDLPGCSKDDRRWTEIFDSIWEQHPEWSKEQVFEATEEEFQSEREEPWNRNW